MLQTTNSKGDTNGTRMGEHYKRKGSMYENSSFNDFH